MADPTTAPQSAADTITTQAGSGSDLNSVLAQVAAAMSAVTNSVNEITNKLNAMESRVKQTSANDDSNFESSVVGVHDPYESLRRSDVSRDRIAVYAEQALANSIEVSHRCAMMHLDHSAALPPIAPRSATGPGNSAS